MAVKMRPRSTAPRSMPVRARYASPMAALAARVAMAAPPLSVTESAPPVAAKGDRNCTIRGWEHTVGLFDNLPGADRSTRRPELITLHTAHTGKTNETPSATAEELRGNIIAAHGDPLPAPVYADPATIVSKSDRNWTTFVEGNGAAVLASRRAAIIPTGLDAGWAAQNAGKKCWR